MLPMLPFLAGVVAGALGVSALRSGRASQSLHQVGQHLREAAHGGQDAARKVLARVGAAPSEPAPPAPPQATRAAPRKRAAAGADGSVSPRVPRKTQSKAAGKATPTAAP